MWDSIAQVLGLVLASIILNVIASYLFEHFKLIKRRWVKWVASTSISLLLVVGVSLSVQPIREHLLGKPVEQSKSEDVREPFAAVSARVEVKKLPLGAEKFQPLVEVEKKRFFQVRVVFDSAGTDVANNINISLAVNQHSQCLHYVKSTLALVNSSNPSGLELDVKDSSEVIDRLYRDYLGLDVGHYTAKANGILSLRFSIDCDVPSGSMDILVKVQARGSKGQPSTDAKATVYWSQ